MDTLDVLIKLEFPSIPSSWGLTNFFLAPETEVIFRFTYDTSIVRHGLGAISALFLPELSHAYEESPKKKTDYDISTLWNVLKVQLEEEKPEPPQLVDRPRWLDDSFDSIEKGDVKLASSGVGGTYFVSAVNASGEQVPISIFKPIDEEPGMFSYFFPPFFHSLIYFCIC